MKKVFYSLTTLFITIALMLPIAVSASEVKTDALVSMKSGQTTGQATITITNKELFAGCEFKAIPGKGVTIDTVSYDISSASAGPVAANDAIFFSFFSGENEFKGTVTATISFTCKKNVDSQIRLESAKIYTLQDGDPNPEEEEKLLNEIIQISYDDNSSSEGDNSENENGNSDQNNDNSDNSSDDNGNNTDDSEIDFTTNSDSSDNHAGSVTTSDNGAAFVVCISLLFVSAFGLLVLKQKKQTEQ